VLFAMAIRCWNSIRVRPIRRCSASPSLGEDSRAASIRMSRPKGGVLCRPRRDGNADWTPNRGVSDPGSRAIVSRADTTGSLTPRFGCRLSAWQTSRCHGATALAIIWQQRVVHDAWRPATARESMALCSAPSSLLDSAPTRVPRGCGH